MSLPDGTLTFFFTDIEGSTRQWETHPERMRAALPLHDAVLTEIIQKHIGHVIKGTGDGILAAFAEPGNALAAALEVQLTFPALPWPEKAMLRVRVALHTGVAQKRDNDYFGQPLNRTARLLGIGHGGQVLLSAATYELVRDNPPQGVTFRDLGAHRLKDLLRPEQIFQLGHPELVDAFPPLKSLDMRLHNLPVQLTSFVGREDDIEQVKGLLKATRLLTLVGTGGAGKTRLALQTGAELVEDYPDGVFVIELAPLTETGQVEGVILAALGIREEAGHSQRQTLIAGLYKRKLLLLLDNCEHLLKACAPLADALLRGCPQVQILATSREALGILGETAHRVPSLHLPAIPNPPVSPAELATLSAFEAVRLFVERAAAVLPDFVLTAENAPAVARLCVRLDGIPLAIELAAARVKALSIEQIVARLDDRFRLLTRGNSAALERHQTLRALMEWSYELLSEPEKALLCRLCVFRGGFTLEAAEQVCSGGDVDESEVLDNLTALVEKSLVSFDAARYRLLETVREYGQEKLKDAKALVHYKRRHCEYFLALHELGPDPYVSAYKEVLHHVIGELDNYRVAIAYCVDIPDAGEIGLKLVVILRDYWYERAAFSEGLDDIHRVLAHPGAQERSVARATALLVLSSLEIGSGALERAKQLCEEALSIYQQHNYKRGISDATSNLALVQAQGGDYVGAAPLFCEAIAIQRELGLYHWERSNLNNLGYNYTVMGEYTEAHRVLQEARDREGGAPDSQTVNLLENIGYLCLVEGDLSGAWAAIRQALLLAHELCIYERILCNLIYGAELFVHLDAPEPALLLTQVARALNERYHILVSHSDRNLHQAHLDTLPGILGPERVASLEEQLAPLSLDSQILRVVQRVTEFEFVARPKNLPGAVA